MKVKAVVRTKETLSLELPDGTVLGFMDGTVADIPEEVAKKYTEKKVGDHRWNQNGAYLILNPKDEKKEKKVEYSVEDDDMVVVQASVDGDVVLSVAYNGKEFGFVDGSKTHVPRDVAKKYLKGKVQDSYWKANGGYLEVLYDPKAEEPEKEEEVKEKTAEDLFDEKLESGEIVKDGRSYAYGEVTTKSDILKALENEL